MDKNLKDKSVYRAELRSNNRLIRNLGLDYLSIYPVPFTEGKSIKLDAITEDGDSIKILGISFGYYTVVTDRLYDDITSKDIGEPTRKLVEYIQRYLGCSIGENTGTNVIRLTIEDIMFACCISKPAAYKALNRLIDFNLLYKTQIKHKYVVNHRYIYRFSPMKFSVIQTEYRNKFNIRIEDNTIIITDRREDNE